MGALEAAEELFEEIIGALRLDQDGTGWRLDGNRIGKEFFPVLVDLVDHFLGGTILRIVLAADQLGAECCDALFDGADVAGVAFVIEPVRAGWLRNPHRLAEFLEDADFCFEGRDGFPEGFVLHDRLQGDMEFEVGAVIPPL